MQEMVSSLRLGPAPFEPVEFDDKLSIGTMTWHADDGVVVRVYRTPSLYEAQEDLVTVLAGHKKDLIGDDGHTFDGEKVLEVITRQRDAERLSGYLLFLWLQYRDLVVGLVPDEVDAKDVDPMDLDTAVWVPRSLAERTDALFERLPDEEERVFEGSAWARDQDLGIVGAHNLFFHLVNQGCPTWMANGIVFVKHGLSLSEEGMKQADAYEQMRNHEGTEA